LYFRERERERAVLANVSAEALINKDFKEMVNKK
jgi:hypothetical protein